MLDFYFPELKDKVWLSSFLEQSEHFGCEYAFGTIYIWQKSYHCKVCRQGNTLFRGSEGKDFVYAMPVGSENLKTDLEIILQDAAERGQKFQMFGLTEADVQAVERVMPGRFAFLPNRNAADYIYRSEDLIMLAGKKYHGKRNHISKFERLYDWNYEDLSAENLEGCFEISREWCKKAGCSEENGLKKETCALNTALKHFKELDLIGGMLRVEGKPAAFTVGERVNSDVFVVHFEKALEEYEGAYTMINREFCRRNLESYRYINREEDMGIEGLRKAKLSYYPAMLLEKYSVRLAE